MVLLKKSDLFKTVIPSKIFESMAMEKPIVLGVEGESADIVRAAGSGVCIEPENSEQLAQVVRHLADHRDEGQDMGRSGRAYVAANFDRNVLADRFLVTLQGLTSGTATAATGG
jgi:glycosyltransferase involved in cell wall biosynthesis